ncbi:MAG: DUF362 domain-containing protein [Gemmataceae bacterium]|nr:DUF362 domain-containing protein [Gemmataceae bacterium]
MSADPLNPIPRRTFLGGVAGGVAAALAAPDPVGADTSPRANPPDGQPAARGNRPSAEELARTMPGPFPGRVIEVGHRGSVVDGSVRADPVRALVARGMKELCGTENPTEAWRRLFGRGDRVGIKVNPVGAPHSISNHATVHAVVEGLRSAGVRPADILVFDRYRRHLLRAGYRDNLPDGCHWEGTVEDYDNVQLAIEGYDPDVFLSMELIDPRRHNPRDDRYRRSHLSLTVSRRVDKIVNLAVLKDHGSGGVTLALKNMSHGFVNNVARSHGGPAFNSCNVFIPAVVALPQIRQKAVLHLIDGLKGVFQGGPSASPRFVWEHRSILFATDPVALDKIGWELVDAERARRNLAPVARCGRMGVHEPHAEGFDMRQPQHIDLAGALGLGVFDRTRIQYRRIDLT